MDSQTPPLAGLPAQRNVPLLRSAIWIALLVLVTIVYAQTVGFDFINLDDGVTVYQNKHVQQGLTPGSIRWTFTSQTLGNWIPVTMLSHLTVSQLFGMNAGMHHLVNVLLHLLAAALLLIFLERATGELWPSAFVALLFATHPLHVESVAWVTERKDVLSSCFFFLALLAYLSYVRRPGLTRYLLVAGLFGMGLLAKPMVVTFPCLLLLLDYWPLRRPRSWRLVWEKLPFAILSAGEAVGTYWIQHRVGSVQAIDFATRASNALCGYIKYISQTFWPIRLAVFYPYPHSIAPWTVGLAAAILITISALTLSVRRSKPWFAVGWFWYIGMLVPVVGFIQTGYQSHADRYSYLPSIGIFIMLGWGGREFVRRWPAVTPALAAAAGVVVLLFTALSWRQVSYWENNETLYTHALAVTDDNWLAHANLGLHLSRIPGRRGEAITHLETALRIQPLAPAVHTNIGGFLAEAGLYDSAIPHFQAALRETPNDVAANSNLGFCLLRTGRYAEAVGPFETALRTEPDSFTAQLGLGETLAGLGRKTEAIGHLEAANRLRPDAQVSRLLYNLKAKPSRLE